ncbi:MAG: DUF421 domain-containing protein [Firmicutes bacterium]|nr:DUF421 domain-containing protein [Bacillota bacterium]
MGKRQIGEMEPFELVITLIIADLATIPMAEQTIPIWYGIVPLFAIAIVHFIISFITNKSTVMRDIISGKPVIVVDQGKIDLKELKNLNMSCEELTEQLRNLDYFDIGDINYAIVERSGKITVIPKTDSLPTTREDLKIKTAETDIFYCIVENGKIIKRNFKELNIGHKIEGIMHDIIHNMLCTREELIFAHLSSSGDIYAQKKGGSIESFKIKLPQEPQPDENELSPLDESRLANKKLRGVK